MSLYERHDSPFYWMLLERPGKPPIKESTKILRDAPDAMSRKRQRHEAREIYTARMNALARTKYELPVERPTIGFSAHADWFATNHLGQRKGADREREILARLKAFFADRDLSTFTRQVAQEYISDRVTHLVPHTTRTIAPSTINREVDVLKAVLREAVPTYLTISPLVGMKKLKPQGKPKKGRTITTAEEGRLLKELTPEDQALYVIAVDSLMRMSNVLDLQWANVRNGGRWLALDDSKTGPYDVVLSTRATAALKKLPKTDAYVFPWRRVAKHTRDRRGAIRRMLQRACFRARVPYGRACGGITFHTATRATGATRLLRGGVDPRTVREIGNWADPRSMDTYIEPDRAGRQRAVNAIGRGV